MGMSCRRGLQVHGRMRVSGCWGLGSPAQSSAAQPISCSLSAPLALPETLQEL